MPSINTHIVLWLIALNLLSLPPLTKPIIIEISIASINILSSPFIPILTYKIKIAGYNILQF